MTETLFEGRMVNYMKTERSGNTAWLVIFKYSHSSVYKCPTQYQTNLPSPQQQVNYVIYSYYIIM